MEQRIQQYVGWMLYEKDTVPCWHGTSHSVFLIGFYWIQHECLIWFLWDLSWISDW